VTDGSEHMIDYQSWRNQKMSEFWKAVGMIGSGCRYSRSEIESMFSEEQWRQEAERRAAIERDIRVRAARERAAVRVRARARGLEPALHS